MNDPYPNLWLHPKTLADILTVWWPPGSWGETVRCGHQCEGGCGWQMGADIGPVITRGLTHWLLGTTGQTLTLLSRHIYFSNQAHFSNTKNKNTYCYVNIFGRRVWTPNCLLGILFPVYEYVWLRTELIWPANYNIGHSIRWIALLHFSLSIIGEHFDQGAF